MTSPSSPTSRHLIPRICTDRNDESYFMSFLVIFCLSLFLFAPSLLSIYKRVFNILLVYIIFFFMCVILKRVIFVHNDERKENEFKRKCVRARGKSSWCREEGDCRKEDQPCYTILLVLYIQRMYYICMYVRSTKVRLTGCLLSSYVAAAISRNSALMSSTSLSSSRSFILRQ